MPENVKLHPHENCNCDRDGVALPPEIVLEVKNLTKKFQVDGGKVLTACDKVNLNAYKGQTLGIIGESGCGKSTLVRTILQIHPATEGEVIFEGQNILKLEGEALRQNRRKIQMVFQDTSALDVSVQEKICELLVRLQREKDITYLFICHDIGLVDLMSHQVAVMYLGNVVELLEKGRLSVNGVHPYTKALIKSIFKVDFKPGEKIQPLEGDIPSPLALPLGCPFQSRCEYCQEICRSEKPQLQEIKKGHFAACHFAK